MTDPFASLHGPRRTAPAGGADRAIAAGRRRIARRRTAATAGASAAVVAGAALTSVLPRAGTDSLAPAATPPSLAVAPTGAVLTADAPLSTLRATPNAAVPAAASPSSVPPAPDPSAGPPTVPPRPGPSEEPPRGQRRPGWIGRSSRAIGIDHANDPAACAAAANPDMTARTGFCTILTGPERVTPGTPVDLSLALCRPAGMAARTVTFYSGYELSLDVASYGEEGEVEEWAWARPGDFPAARRTVTFEPGDCRTWTVRWAGQGDDGYALAAGTYQVNAYPYAYDWVDEDGDDPQGPMPRYYTVEVS